MNKDIALLRGINVGGKNKINMSELKISFIELGYTKVSTHLNSGNVAFSNDIDDKVILSNTIKLMIKTKFELDIQVFIISQVELIDILNNAPEWWGNEDKEIYDNLIFLLPCITFDKLYDKAGLPKDEYEKIYNYKNVVFWSFKRKDYQKTNWWSKTASKNISNKITIRTANTIKKIVNM